MGNQIIITKDKSKIITSLFCEDKLISIQVDDEEGQGILGNIYLGKVKNIVKNINAAFVEIADKQVCYLSISSKEKPVFANPRGDEKLRVGDEIVVQVSKESRSSKAAVLTTSFSLTGKYVVLVHGRPMLGISSKITDENVRDELKSIVKPHIGENYGLILRTNAQAASRELLERELMKLKADYDRLVNFGIHWNCFSKLYTTPPMYLWEIRDGFAEEIETIKTDDLHLYNQIRDYLQEMQDEDLHKLHLFKEEGVSLNVLYGIGSKLKAALNERVWLPCGGYLVIQPTEALVAIDVNTGKAVSGKHSPEDTYYKVNMEAAREIAHQLRLRNLSGIIIIDFIDMVTEKHKNQLMETLRELLSKDRIKTTVVDMTPLNLVEITRQKIKRPLYEQVLVD